MRAIWSGEIAFGLVTIPTKLYPATHDLTPRFHWLHKACGTRVQTVRRCPHCDRDISWDEVERGYEVAKDRYVPLDKAALAEAENDEPKGTIEIVAFVEPGEVDLAYISKSYWVGASGKTARSFDLLHTVLEKSSRVGLAKVALRARTHLALLRPRNKLLSLDLMRFEDELVDGSDVAMPASRAPSDKELKLARTLVEQLSAPFEPSKYPDEYRARVGALVDKAVESERTPKKTSRGQGKGAKVIDLSELLVRSIETDKPRSRPRAASASRRTRTGGLHHAKRRAAG